VWYAGLSWLPGNDRFTYTPMHSKDVHDTKRMLDLIVYIHNIGDKYDNDTPIFSSTMYPDLNMEPKEIPVVYYDKDNDKIYLFHYTVESNLKVFIADVSEIDDKKIRWKMLFDRDDKVYGFISTKVDIYAYTANNAPNFKIVKTSLNNPDIKNAKTVIEEEKEGKIESFVITNEGLFYNLSKNGVKQELYFLSKDKKEAQQIDLPVTAGRLRLTAKGIDYPDLWININGWTTDYTRYRYKATDNEFIKETLSSQAEYPEYKNLVVEELMIPSHDGVMVPLSLIYDKNLNMDGNNPVLIRGYGAYGISSNPFFSPSYLLPTTKGAIFAIAHVRGGGELGEKWYKAGFKTTKPNTWKDLIACAEYLVKENYTNPGKIAINGGSAGGILIGRAMTERPDLFAAAIPEVGCMNTVRAEFSPNGPGNIPEFGTVKDSVECMALIEMDSYHNIQDATNYPATLVTAGFNDPRVIAWNPAKFAARLMAANGSNKPVLLWVDFKSGHGIGDSKSQYFESLADKFSFALWQSGHPEFKSNY
ncbi:MAG: prolyl oligopeptidase family serine peptidase, partial [Bacteroidales bacterium]|nr:prolyl oligopeptidase family serine peptidase [Bacteroidales bacterium]